MPSSVTHEDEERTPLLKEPEIKAMRHGFFSPYRRMLVVAFVLSFAFGCTNTPIVYAYRKFTCDEYYNSHPPYTGHGDRCSIHDIESSTAKSLSLMVTLTTVSGVLNLLTTGWLMRNYGVRAALINQTAWPCLRNLCQILGIIKGGTFGIVIFQLTQTITALGGGAGYLLAANSFVAAVVDPEERTACFGQLQGVAMAGTAVAFTIGGVLGDTFGLVSPFAFTFCLLVFSTILSRFALPYIAPEATESKDGDGKVGSRGVWGGIKSFFKPLKVFAPRKLRSLGGKTYYGVTLLAVGNFISVLATAYVPLMLQLISTNLYAFGPSKNGYLMSTFALCRAVFLTFAFPQIIKYGRAWYNKGHAQSQDLDAKKKKTRGGASERSRLIDGEDSGDDTSETAAEDEDSSSDDGAKTRSGHHHSGFDLVFLRISILVDACLTACVAFADRGWQMYLAAAILPLASGTAAASKGVVMEMVTPEQKPDALSAVSLVELTATVTTVSIFGAIFAYLSEQGKPNVVFVLNGATALVSTALLLFVRLPPKEEKQEEEEEDDDGEAEQ